ncbi:MAG: dTDP-4-dehydrorhamnose 3,5-epimerase [Deltaproteobacteria bacterium CG_4_8_14_3_um_filter_51_11]|nr:dTDP-4-dehydrorhamnose 3,5-epimerase [bacterium]OIP40196.1 MAG: dTDP-4-dehydrorhamnose 3,5-epimerase [Desulfobacteraceae bacterium CG2_30_51_40]PIP46020.1 MAG: dTDP-4-dehydrorhamnose 3,5-epimerase [Deltaproteobacteria bacterium CG23_combo_of_CG06-09_8_20_14_all_51_20]PIV99881.1 MAG: dTDP-4-dehydrorhamnose 3,5-epimerase [Deltaproteobacteria bacterium CG17_big_fil_post_rev_8_21_14_2_50_51_6]PIX18461.1 MAG: dTDP-4-dehydrorhamnose 3,5-epimerase [Deltaproteobacteria bacterium CG_4_8_14_3_um_filte
MKFIDAPLPGVVVIEPDVYRDGRGLFLETFHDGRYKDGGISRSFVQDNRSRSRRGVLRGLHYQLRHPQAKLIYAVRGEIFDVVVDIRAGSATFGKSYSTVLAGDNFKQVFVPEGYAHGFCVISDEAEVIYKCTDFYTPGDEYGVQWCDPFLGIAWPVTNPILSEKDAKYPPLLDIPAELLPNGHGR